MASGAGIYLSYISTYDSGTHPLLSTQQIHSYFHLLGAAHQSWLDPLDDKNILVYISIEELQTLETTKNLILFRTRVNAPVPTHCNAYKGDGTCGPQLCQVLVNIIGKNYTPM